MNIKCQASHTPQGVPTLNDADHPLYGAASAALRVANGRQSGNAMNEVVAAMAKRAPILAAAPDLLAATQILLHWHSTPDSRRQTASQSDKELARMCEAAGIDIGGLLSSNSTAWVGALTALKERIREFAETAIAKAKGER